MKKTILFLITLSFISCTDATISSFKAYGDEHTVELYSGGKKVREWISTGKVISESSSDGYKFMDSKTNKLVRVSGDVVITILNKEQTKELK